jgi:hypothetical protein
MATIGCLIAPETMACIPMSLEQIRKFSDVIVEGTFVVDSAERGEGHITPKRILKGSPKKIYPVRWDPHPELVFQPHELDCLVSIPESDTFEGFDLSKEKRGLYRIIGRWQRVEKEQ